jgi:hypothetical protein
MAKHQKTDWIGRNEFEGKKVIKDHRRHVKPDCTPHAREVPELLAHSLSDSIPATQ